MQYNTSSISSAPPTPKPTEGALGLHSQFRLQFICLTLRGWLQLRFDFGSISTAIRQSNLSRIAVETDA